MVRLFDAHCHLQDPRLAHCVDSMIVDALARGVRHFSCNGCCENDWEQVHQLAEKYPCITPNFGLHPWWVEGRSEGWLSKLRDALLRVPTAGLGECGLDHAKRGIAEMPVQEAAFREQLRLGRELQRPVSVHCVKAFGALQDILEQEGPFPAGLVLHSWAGSDMMTKRLASMEGMHFSISGHSLGLSDKRLLPMLKEVPLGRLLLETDAPDGLRPLQKRQILGLSSVPAHDEQQEAWNHPANTRAVLMFVASHVDEPQEEVEKAAFDNATNLFCQRL